MSEFKTEVVKVRISSHMNADSLELAHIGGFVSIVRKGQYETGDKVAYIQPGSIVPEEILEEMGLVGKLGGGQRNRVKPVKLRGVLSEGLCYPAKDEWELGQDVSHELGIVKWIPNAAGSNNRMRVPPNGTYQAGPLRTVKYDIENIKKYSDLLLPNEEVVITEKIHGTFCCVGLMSYQNIHPEYGALVPTSKGLGRRGVAYKPDEEENKDVYYVQAGKAIQKAIGVVVGEAIDSQSGIPWIAQLLMTNSVFIMGEVFGGNIQDLNYGVDEPKFRCFDIAIRPDIRPELLLYLGDEDLQYLCDEIGIERVPVLYRGPYSPSILQKYTDGKETISGDEGHIREGVVVTPVNERHSWNISRIKLKSVSDDYHTRKNGTEFN